MNWLGLFRWIKGVKGNRKGEGKKEPKRRKEEPEENEK
jgi:hypothetical protein